MTSGPLRWLPVAALIAAFALPAARADDARPGVMLELNRLVDDAGACHLYFLVGNALDRPIPKLAIDVALFDKEGVAIGRADIDLGRLRARKTTLRSVGLVGVPCARVGRVLLDDVVSCGAGTAPEADRDCLGLVTLRHRGEVVFFK